MSVICRTVTDWVETTILDPVENWISQQEEKCSQWPWPLSWLCKWVTVLVSVIVWISKTILKPITTLICNIITTVIGLVFMVPGLLFDVVAQPLGLNWSMQSWIKHWFLYGTHVTYIKKTPLPNGGYAYIFKCACKNGGESQINIQANSDAEAAEVAKKKCQEKCECSVKMISKNPSTTQVGYFDYVFECTCKGVTTSLFISQTGDSVAAAEASKQC